MKTLIIYDGQGTVLGAMTGGEYAAVGTVVVDVPDGYTVTGVNAETGEAVLTPKPATEAERTAAIEKQMMAQAAAHAGTYEDPIPFVYGMATEYQKHYSYGGVIYNWADSFCPACVWLPDSGIWQWAVATAPGEYAEWVQPVGAADAYNTGDIVRYNGTLYISTMDGNVWAPDAYPDAWDVYEVTA